jgi:hypothetical protein
LGDPLFELGITVVIMIADGFEELGIASRAAGVVCVKFCKNVVAIR